MEKPSGLINKQPSSTRKKQKADPLLDFLGEELFKHVFGFLVGTGKGVGSSCDLSKKSWLLKAAKSQAQLRSVSSAWKKRVDNAISDWLGGIDLVLGIDGGGDSSDSSDSDSDSDDEGYFGNLISSETKRSLLRWLCRFKASLTALLADVYLPDVPFIRQLLLHCNTEGITKMQLNVEGMQRSSCCLLPLQNFNTNDKPNYDFSEGANNEIYLKNRSVLVTEIKNLHDIVAEICPNLTELDITVTVAGASNDFFKYISGPLFSMPKLCTLKISLAHIFNGARCIGRSDSLIFTKLIKNLPALRELYIQPLLVPGFHGLLRSYWCEVTRRFHVESSQLEILDLVDARFSRHLVISCNCPNLKEYRCSSFVHPTGTMPLLTAQQFKDIASFIGQDETHGSEDLVVEARSMKFPPNIQVPSTCKMVLKRFKYLGKFDSYTQYVNECFVAAKFDTYDDKSGVEEEILPCEFHPEIIDLVNS